jgi:putative hydrolase of the HAD superfamily
MQDKHSMKFDMIAFDADDTLWDNEIHYRSAQSALVNLLEPYGVEEQIVLDMLHQQDIANLPDFGYGIKGFTLSMIETAVEATRGKVSGDDIQAIVSLGRAMVRREVLLMDHAANTVKHLAATHPLMMITKGDLMDQERKLSGSGLGKYFRYVEIVSDKRDEVYASLLAKHNIAPGRFLMVGNAMRSDILPVLSLGGWAVYVPYHLTWVHESGTTPGHTDGRFHEIAHLGLLPELVTHLEQEA